ncbi:MAG: Imm51 family immunity protein [Polyangiaceae bacterium]
MAKTSTTKKPAAKKPAAKKPAAKKPAAKKPAAKKPAAKKPAAKKPAAKKPAAKKKPVNELEPFFLLPPESEGPFNLCLADVDSPEVFEDEGHSGSGYAWDSIARMAMKDWPEAKKALVSFDSEAGTFVALADTSEPLEELGKALLGLIRDEDALRATIRAVPEDDWDD